MTNILITGGAGYIGSTLSKILLDSGFKVKVVDNLTFGGESLLSLVGNSNFEFIKADIRSTEILKPHLSEVDAVIHLAAIVGDPACSKQPELAEEINWLAAKNLFDYCNENTKVQRFIFASTCSNYGKMKELDYCIEESAVTPVSLYAKLKVKFEEYITKTKTRESFIPTALRFATVYGFSPRMRFDLTVNEFVRDLYFNKKLIVFGEQFWRPYCHVSDIAKACLLVLKSDAEKVDHNVFNVGSTVENYTKKNLVELISPKVSKPIVEYVHKEEDPRDYKVNFEKISTSLGFKTTMIVEKGIEEILKVLKSNIISDPYDNKFKNI